MVSCFRKRSVGICEFSSIETKSCHTTTRVVYVIGYTKVYPNLEDNTILLPFAIDPQGCRGPILDHFFLQSSGNLPYTFPTNRPNAKVMFVRSTTAPSPISILCTADSIWKRTKSRPFFEHSYKTPTPSISLIQQLGLGITKAFATRIQNATRRNPQVSDQESNPNHALDQPLVLHGT